MTGWLSQQLQTLTLTLRRLASAPVGSLLTILAISIALSLPAGLYTLLQNLQRTAGRIEGEPHLTLFLAQQTSPEQIRQLESRLKSHAALREVRFIPRDQALHELAQSAGLDDLLAGLKRNPLPDAFVLKPRTPSPEALETLRAELQQWPAVELAQMDSAWARRLDALLRFARQTVLLLALLLGVALVVITGNTIRLQILTRREEIEVSKLIGATDPFIRRPFLYFGALQGLAGGAAAWLIIRASLHALNRSLEPLAALYQTDFRLQPLGAADSLALLLFAALLGWLGAYLVVNRHLRQL